MEWAKKHFLKMALNLSFTHKACMDYILAGQFKYITKNQYGLLIPEFFVHTII